MSRLSLLAMHLGTKSNIENKIEGIAILNAILGIAPPHLHYSPPILAETKIYFFLGKLLPKYQITTNKKEAINEKRAINPRY